MVDTILVNLIPGPSGSLASPSGTGFIHVTGGAIDAAARAVNLASADVTATLPTGLGGTGLATIGTANQVLASTGSVLHYVNAATVALTQLTQDVTAGPGVGSVAATVVQAQAGAFTFGTNGGVNYGGLAILSGTPALWLGTGLSFGVTNFAIASDGTNCIVNGITSVTADVNNVPQMRVFSGRVSCVGNVNLCVAGTSDVGSGVGLLALGVVTTAPTTSTSTGALIYLGSGGGAINFYPPGVTASTVLINQNGLLTTATNDVCINTSTHFSAGGAGVLSLAKASTNPHTSQQNGAVLYSDITTGAFGVITPGSGLPVIFMAAQPITDAAVAQCVINAPNALSSATTNITGGTISLQAGTGATAANGGISGNVIAEVFAPTAPATTEGFFQVQRSGVPYVQIGALLGNASTVAAIYMGTTLVPSSTNYTLATTGSTSLTQVVLNAKGASGNVSLAVGGVSTVLVTGTAAVIATGCSFVVFGNGSAGLTSGAVGAVSIGTVSTAPTVSTTNEAVLYTDGSGNLNIYPSGVTASSAVISSTALTLAGSTYSITFGIATSSPTIQQTTTAVNSATGKTMTIQAQNASGTTSNGGNLVVTSGTGTSSAGTVSLQYGGTEVAILGRQGSGFLWDFVSGVSVAGGSFSLSAAQYGVFTIRLTGAMPGAVIVTFPNQQGCWEVDISKVTGISGVNTLIFQSGSAQSPTGGITALTATQGLVRVNCYGSNSISTNI